jgi:hypothetical protein
MGTTIPSVQQEGDQETATEDHGAMGLSRSESTGKQGANGGICGGSGHSVEGLGLMEEEGGTSFVEASEDAVCLESAEDGAAPERGSGGSGENAGVLGLSVGLPISSYSTLKRGTEVNRCLSGPGFTGVMESGPDSVIDDPAPGQERKGNSPEWAQLVSPASYRSGSVEQAPNSNPEEGMLHAG